MDPLSLCITGELRRHKTSWSCANNHRRRAVAHAWPTVSFMLHHSQPARDEGYLNLHANRSIAIVVRGHILFSSIFIEPLLAASRSLC
jgi:hypothetical protein